jgi:hypothetical protein
VRHRHADQPQLGSRNGSKPDLVAGEADSARANRLAQLRVDLEQHLPDDCDRGLVGHAPSVDERHRQSGTHHCRGDLPAAAVHNDRVPKLAEVRPDDRAADLHDKAAHVVYSALILT